MRKLKEVFWLVVSLALGIGALYWGAQFVSSVITDRSLWARGTPASQVRVGGRVNADRMILKTYGLDLEFQDTAGGLHRGHEEFTTLFTSVDRAQRPELRYDPSDPNRFVLSWALDVTGGRLMAAALFLVMGPVFLVGAVAIARGRQRGPPPSTPPVPTEWR